MEAELRIFLNFSSTEYERETKREDEAVLCSALKQVLGDNRALQTDCYISVPGFSTSDLAIVRKTSRELRIAISCGIEERLVKSELRQVRFARLAIQGDCIDHDSDWNPLNRFPSLLCLECKMPDESKLPGTFYVSSKQMLRRRQDAVPGVPLPTKREIFGCSGGVFVATERVKRIFELLKQSVICVPVAATPSAELPIPCWAIQSAQTWGRRKHVIMSDPCAACGHPRRCHRDMDVEAETLWPNRLILLEDAITDRDFVCSETWFGHRTRRPSESFDFHREIFASGRLYDVLLRAKIRGLRPPEEFVSFEDAIPTVEDKTARAWVKAKLDTLKSQGLVG